MGVWEATRGSVADVGGGDWDLDRDTNTTFYHQPRYRLPTERRVAFYISIKRYRCHKSIGIFYF